MEISLSLSLTGRLLSSSPATALFSVPGSRGFFYDFSDYTTQFTDTAGTTAITGVGQSLARVNDKSGLGNNATQATAGSRALTQVRPMFTQRNRAVGSELPENNFYWQASLTTNGVTYTRVATGIDTDGLPYVDYSVVGTATADSFFEAQNATTQRIPAATGQTWTVSMIARRLSGVAPGAGQGVIPYIRGETAPDTITETSTLAYNPANTETTLSTTFTLANAATNQIRSAVSFRVSTGNTVNYVMRVKAFQLELGSARTTYQPAVSGELRNLLTFSEQFDDAGWLKTDSSVIANSAAAPDGTNTADLLAENTATAVHAVSQATGALWPDNTPYTATIYAKAAGRSIFWIESRSKTPTFPQVYFDLASGQVTSAVSGATGSIQAVGNGWYRCTLTANSLTGAAFPNLVCGPAITTGTRSYTGDGTSGVLIWGAQVELGSTYSRYQRTITANEWYEPGFTSYRGIRFDGSDDFLQTAAIDFAGAESLGAELVTNGDFSAGATGWTSTAWVISGGAATLTNASDSLTQNVSFVAGRTYRVQFTLSGFSGTGAFRPRFFGGTTVTGTNRSADGTYSEYIVAVAGNNQFAMTPSTATCTGTIDNISVREVLIPADKMTVVAGVRKLSDAAQAELLGLTAAPPTGSGTFWLQTPNAAAATNYVWNSRGTATSATSATPFAAPDTAVITGIGDISGDSGIIRRNGVQISTSAADQGTGNYANNIVYIGRRGGTTLPFNGVLTFLCVINRTLTASELAQLETFANSRTGAY